MAQVKPMLGDIELQLVQQLEVNGIQVLAEHSVPALEGDFLQGLGRRSTYIVLSGVLTGTDAGKGLKDLREKFRAAEPVSFVADINTATKIDKVIIEKMEVKELAGKPERFEYAFTLREYTPLLPAATEEPPKPDVPKLPDDKIDKNLGTLRVDVTVEGQTDFDYSHVRVTVEGNEQDGTKLSRTLTNRTDNVWTEENFPAGEYTIKASANSQPMSGLAKVAFQPGQSGNSSVTLKPTSIFATTFLIHFRFNSAFVEPSMLPILREVAKYAKNHADEKLVIVGHSDKVGDPDENQYLSERRARAVFAYMSFGTSESSRTESLAEWNALRQKRPKGEKPSIKDNWGTREYKHILQDLGFYPGIVDGNSDKQTADAVRAYRCHKGFPDGTSVDDDVWQALIEDYLEQNNLSKDNLSVPLIQFFPNCPNEILKWLGCGDEDPRDRRGTAFRPSRRVELLFVKTDQLPCKIPQPETFNLPAPGAVNSSWCVGSETDKKHCCLVTPYMDAKGNPQPCTSSPQGPWCRQPAEPGTITVKGSIQRELPDGTLQPVKGQAFVLSAPEGQFKAGEQANGEPVPAKTSTTDGTFSFDNMPLGFYSLEVITPKTSPILVTLKEQADQDVVVKGPSVSKALRSDQDRLDVVIVNAPILREIHLPVAAHLMTALNFTARDIRTCPDPSNAANKIKQATARTEAEIKTLFEEANRIWRQARVRFDLKDIVKEAYAHPIEDPNVRGSCEVDKGEFSFILSKCAYKGVVNVFFFKDFVGSTEAGMGISVEDGTGGGLLGGCAVADQIRIKSLGLPTVVSLDKNVLTHVLAHELGHYLNLKDLPDTPANADFLMLSTTKILPSGALTAKEILSSDEVKRSRSSLGATDSCVPLSFAVSGAAQIGGTLSDRFIVVQNSGGSVTVDAQIPDSLVDPKKGTLSLKCEEPGANNRQCIVGDRQCIVSTSKIGITEVIATYTPAGVGKKPVIKRVTIHVVNFSLQVNGAERVSDSTTFVAKRDPTQIITIIADISPSLFCVPKNLVTWSAGSEMPDPLRRTVSRSAIAKTVVNATMAGVTRTVTIMVVDIALTSNVQPFDAAIKQVQIEGVVNSDLKSFNLGNLFGHQRASVFRARADIPGINSNSLSARLTSNKANNQVIEDVGITLTRIGGDRFISLPIVTVPSIFGIPADLKLKEPKDIEVVRGEAGGTLQLRVVDVNLAGLDIVKATVRGRVLYLFMQALANSTTGDSSGITLDDLKRKLAKANRIWAQAGIEVKARKLISPAESPAELLDVEHTDNTGINLTEEEKRLVGRIVRAGDPVRSTIPTDLNVFYVRSLDAPPPPDKDPAGIAYPNDPVIIIEGLKMGIPQTKDEALAHEIGHQILNWGGRDEHQDLTGKEWPSTNVLHRTDTGGTDVDRTQATDIVNSTFVGINKFVIFEP